MKITQQLIAAASFASLLFAPLAQAQTTGNTELTVLGSGLTVTATDLNFGTLSPPLNSAAPVILSCAVGSASIAGVGVSGSSCGEITVQAGPDGGSYKLQISPTVLTGADGARTTITANFRVFDAGVTAPIDGLDSVTGGSVGIADNADTLGADGSTTYILGGSAEIEPDQALTTYTGTYTVAAVVQ